jgi:PEP-CTERM motif
MSVNRFVRSTIGLWIFYTLFSVFFALTFERSAAAGIVIVEPDAFPSGTDLTHVFPGVTLSVDPTNVVGKPPTKIISANGTVGGYCCNPSPPTTGTQVFGQDPDPFPGLQKFNEDEFGMFRADFSSFTDYVQIDMIFDDDDVGILRAFDAGGSLLDFLIVSGAGDQRDGLPPYVTGVISRPIPDIAYITVGGLGREGDLLDNMRFNLIEAPEPTTLSILALGLAGLRLMRRRRAH